MNAARSLLLDPDVSSFLAARIAPGAGWQVTKPNGGAVGSERAYCLNWAAVECFVRGEHVS